VIFNDSAGSETRQPRWLALSRLSERLGGLAGFSHRPLFFLGLILSLFGLIMIYSASAVLGMQKSGDALFYVKKQALFLGLGWALYFLVAQFDVSKLCRFRLMFLVMGLLLLVAVMIPGLGQAAGGAQRWLSLGFLTIQPSELVRLLLVFYLAGTLSFRQDRLHSFNRGFLPLLVVTSVLMLLLLFQPDFGGAMGVLLLSVALWFVGGVPLSFLAGLVVLAIPAMIFILFSASYRAERVMTFLNPWKDPQGNGFQVIQSFAAFHQGGWSGQGLGNSTQKLFYLPEAHTDFIFSLIGEELGVVGVFTVVSLFVARLFFGARIAKSQESSESYYLATGVSIFLCLPATLNMMVTMGLLPTKGLPLPFFSYGGSSLLVSLLSLGILQSLYRKSQITEARR
jgi:cell division protein FtsW